MGKKNKDKKDDTPNPNSIPNRDIIQRLNFLYQASVCLNQIAAAGASTTQSSSDARQRRSAETQGATQATSKRKRTATATDMSRSYVKAMRVIGQKTNVRMDPSVKRTLCKTCDTVLVPGSTETVRVKSLPSHGHAITYTCKACGASRRIPAPPTTAPRFYPAPAQMQRERAGNVTVAGLEAASATAPDQATKKAQRKKQRREKKLPAARPPPSFERDGHIIFVGNERLRTEDER